MPHRDEARQLKSVCDSSHLAAAVAPPTRYGHASGASPIRRGGAIHGGANAVPEADLRQRNLTPNVTDLNGARARYVTALQDTYPAIDAQLSDVIGLLQVLLGADRPADGGLLADARTVYLARLAHACSGLEEQVRDLAKACSDLFAPALGLPGAPRPSPPRPAPPDISSGRRTAVDRTVRPCAHAQSPEIPSSAEQGSCHQCPSMQSR